MDDYNAAPVKVYPHVPLRLGLIFPAHPVYFVTCCTHQRRKILHTDAVHNEFVQFAQKAFATSNIAVGRYVIMPDHLHFFVSGHDDFILGSWVGTTKRVLAKRVVSAPPVWQRGFFDHLLRSSESYVEKWSYVCDNPVRAGLTRTAEDWPFAGEIVDLYYD